MAEDVQSYIDSIDMEYAYDLAETLAYDEEYWDNELGWRTAGSDAEHRAADFLVEEMKSIGLTDVEKVGTTVDKFQQPYHRGDRHRSDAGVVPVQRY